MSRNDIEIEITDLPAVKGRKPGRWGRGTIDLHPVIIRFTIHGKDTGGLAVGWPDLVTVKPRSARKIANSIRDAFWRKVDSYSQPPPPSFEEQADFGFHSFFRERPDSGPRNFWDRLRDTADEAQRRAENSRRQSTAVPPRTGLPWHVLGLAGATDRETAKAAYHKAALAAHPDRGGKHGDMTKINEAWTTIKTALRWA